jgi:hypothetical protein
MQNIPENAGYDQVKNGTVTELKRVEADEEVAPLAAGYGTTVAEYLALFAQIDSLRLSWIEADARLRVLDRRLDKVVKAFRLKLVELSGNKQIGPLFDRYMPSGLRAVTEAEMAVAEPQQVGTIIEKLNTAGGDLATEWIPRFTTARDAVLAQAGIRIGIERQQERLDDQLDAKINELRGARVELHGMLRGHFKDSPDLAEEYFFAWRKISRRAAAPATPADPASPAP